MTTPKIIAVAAAAVGAAGMVTVPLTASAEPACLDWRFPDAALFLDLDNGVNIGVPWLAGTNKVRVTQGAAILHSPDGGTWQGDIEPGGGTYQGDTIKFRIDWTQGVGGEHPKSEFNGKISPDGVATGTTVNEKNVTNGWTAQGKFTCTARAAEPAAPKPADPGPPPADQNTATITDNVDLYENPGGEGQPVDFVPAGRKVKVLTRQADNWVKISGSGVPNHDTGWVWGDFVKG
ncbi:SH3 domain-containing protein [Mycobacterium sp. 1274761.0]|uniref:SH3 domain-containing protein n=1 Tax=Mycobacterium sp. 1274761.0 TaxID=1834077 RepID=UPI00080235FD|nr:SH3 domain-containing protein [Mycobacterium sp. 1274761.0]OBK70566.1 hypothetical protein A5651_22255 [Mycobacterium sp. 1274761.0]